MSDIETGGYEHRFGGLFRLYGKPALGALRQAHVLIVGIGGVSRLTLIDWDDICFPNTTRQIHAMTGTAGQAKVDILADLDAVQETA
jgi:tRNA A37 threonylcarbamoyladenosine dehydratase